MYQLEHPTVQPIEPGHTGPLLAEVFETAIVCDGLSRIFVESKMRVMIGTGEQSAKIAFPLG